MVKRKVLSCILIAAVLVSLAAGSGALSVQSYAAGEDSEESETKAAEEPEDLPTFTINETEGQQYDFPNPDGDAQEAQETARGLEDETVTVMIYMIGSNLESAYREGTKNLEEMMYSGFDEDRCNVLVFTGGSQAWWYEGIPNDRNMVYRIKRDGFDVVSQTDYNWDMGEPDTLSAFLNFGYEYYPADHYALVLWDHGGGPIEGYGSDYWYYDDALSYYEMQEALENSYFGESARFDWVCYDACLMGGIEMANFWADYADYMIASEEEEYGLDFSFLSVLNETVDPEEIGEAIVDGYVQKMVSDTDYTYLYEYSVLDLSEVSGVMSALDALSARMLADINDSRYGFEYYYMYALVRNELTTFSTFDDSWDLVDMTDFAGWMGEIYPELAEDLLDSLDDLIVYNQSNIPGAEGVSIYYPYDCRDIYFNEDDYYVNTWGEIYEDEVVMPESYQAYLDAFSGYWDMEGDFTPIEEGEEGGEESADEISIHLTDEQLDVMADVSYTVFIDTAGILGDTQEEGLLTPVLYNCSVEPDEDGDIHIPKTVNLFYLQDENTQPWVFQQVSETDEYIDYDTVDTLLGGPAIFTNYSDDQAVQIRVRCYKEDGSYEILSYTSVDEDIPGAAPVAVELADYDTIYCYMPRYEAQGDVPYTEWENYDYSVIHLEDCSEGWTYILPGTSDMSVYPVYCQAVMEDVYGGIYYSDLYELNWNDREKITVETVSGEMTFSDLGDSVLLTEYTGTDTELEIPASVNGLPVTGIDDKVFMENETLEAVTIPGTVTEVHWEAFYGCTALTTVELNEGLETIAEGAFASCRYLTTVNIPASVTKIGTAAFGECDSLKYLTLAQGNQSYQLVDGLLFTADGTILVSYTALAGETCVIPEGVTEIASGAFAAQRTLHQVVFPETLERIGNFAFFETPWMENPEFPDSLTYIGNGAFRLGQFEGYYNEDREEEGLPDPWIVEIGPNLIHINQNAFSDGITGWFVVDQDNRYYASTADGSLANKEGDYVICEAYNGE